MSHSQCSTFSLALACISQGTKWCFIQSPTHSFMEPLSYSRGCHYIRSLVCSHCLFLYYPTPTPLLSVEVLPSDCTVLYYMLYAQPFLFCPRSVPQSERGSLDFKNCFFAKRTYFTENTYTPSNNGTAGMA